MFACMCIHRYMYLYMNKCISYTIDVDVYLHVYA